MKGKNLNVYRVNNYMRIEHQWFLEIDKTLIRLEDQNLINYLEVDYLLAEQKQLNKRLHKLSKN